MRLLMNQLIKRKSQKQIPKGDSQEASLDGQELNGSQAARRGEMPG